MAEPDIDVTVIIAVRNGAETLGQCIDSVLGQEGCMVELIIVDAMSDDGTQEIVESYSDRIATYIREPDTGIYDAWNKALGVTRGEWCAFLGADDYYIASDAVRALVDVARAATTTRPVYVYGGIRMSDGNCYRDILPVPRDPVMFLRRGSMLPHPGSLHQCKALREVEGFDSTFHIAGDLDAVIRMARLGRIAHSPRLVTFFRLGGVSNREATAQIERQEVRRIVARESGNWFMARTEVTRLLDRLLGRAAKAVLVAILGKDRAMRIISRMRRDSLESSGNQVDFAPSAAADALVDRARSLSALEHEEEVSEQEEGADR